MRLSFAAANAVREELAAQVNQESFRRFGTIGAVNVAGAQSAAFEVAKLVEHEQRVKVQA